MKIHYLFLIIMLVCAENAIADNSNLHIIPQPRQLVAGDGCFLVNSHTTVYVGRDNDTIKGIVSQFVDHFRLVSKLSLSPAASPLADNAIRFYFDKTVSSPEGYRLVVTRKGVDLYAASARGLFYALQTLYQLMPVQIYGNVAVDLPWKIPAVTISDSPRFAYRGLHLDVCRHFFSVDFVKRYIDAMAIHKLNVFHWHLTDDQGWRMEIKRYPMLVKVGSKRVETLVGTYFENFPQRFDDEAYGGYYTQEQMRDVVKYAQERFITVVPEIEMPGHAMAALAAYPELSCTQKPVKVATKWGVFKDVFCSRDSTFHFLENVLDEVIDIFPSKLIHIGGDECPRDRWRSCADCQSKIKSLGLKDENGLQSYFVNRIADYLKSKGRRAVGWDEILDGDGVTDNAVVMSWRGMDGGEKAARKGHQVIMTPLASCYFDHYQGEQSKEPPAIGGFLPLRTVYAFDPVPAALNTSQASLIIGAQANVWTEYIKSEKQVEYMVFPRLAAMAEVLWSSPDVKSWKTFRCKIPFMQDVYKQLGIRAATVCDDVYAEIKTRGGDGVVVNLQTECADTQIRYSLDGSIPDGTSLLYADSLLFTSDADLRAQAYRQGKAVGKPFSQKLMVSKLTGRKCISTNPVLPDWACRMLTDAVMGNKRTTESWVVICKNNDAELTYDLIKKQGVSRVSIGFLNAPAFNIYYPPVVTIAVSDDGIQFKTIASDSITTSKKTGYWDVYRAELIFPPVKTRFVRIQLKNAGAGANPDSENGTSLVGVDEINVW